MHPTFITRGDIRIVGLGQPFRLSEGLDGQAALRRFGPFLERIENSGGLPEDLFGKC